MAKAAAKTGIGPTTLVAIEQYFPEKERIIKDDFAYKMHPFILKLILRLTQYDWLRNWMISKMEKSFPGLYASMMCRKKYIDEKIIDSVSQINAVVNLGAGFDTSALRISELSKIPIWEIDQRENIQSKQKRLEEIFGTIPSHIKLVSTDFDHEELGTVLNSYDFSNNIKTFFIWEAVTQYLTENGIRSTFNFLAHAVSGSRLVFTYVRKDFIDGKVMYNWENNYKRFVKDSKIWIFGMEVGEWEDFMKDSGWHVIEDVGYDELNKKYIESTGRILSSTPVERIVYAEKL
jgi:methyltransferase (TIGR00027 family)